MQRSAYLLAGFVLASALPALAATPDLPSCDVWTLACHYTSSNRESSYDINRVVIHKTQGGSAAGAASWFANCNSGGSAHFTFDKSNGYCYQSVYEKDIAWHAGYGSTNNNSVGIEHSGWVANNDTSTACYDESALETRSCIVYYGVPWDRNHIIAHSEVPGCAGTGGGLNCHTDPGPYWNWSYYMAKCNPNAGVKNPSYYFGSDNDGFTPGPRSGAIAWTNCCGWPGVAFADQTGDDMYWYSPTTNYQGGGDPSINVQVYAQNGSSASHTMQMFWKTNAENFWDAAKSSQRVNYTAQNGWTSINLSLNNPKYWWQTINQLRLDFDDTNVGARFIVNHVYLQTTPRQWFNGGTDGWTAMHNIATPWWTNCCGWPGILVADQTGTDPHMQGPTFNMLGAKNDIVQIRLYPQNGTTANHDIQVYWKTAAEPFYSDSKSTGRINYTAQNQWITLNFNVGANGSWPANWIQQLRVDFDHSANTQTRYLVDYIIVDHTI